jgi:hypothetical protein
MYDELARAHDPSRLERFVLNALIPSVVLSFALHEPPVATATLTERALAPLSTPPFVFITTPCNPLSFDVPDIFPVLVSMPHVTYPADMPRSEGNGRVRLKALVNTAGLVDPASIRVLGVTDVRLLAPARHALIAARFRPAWLGGKRIAAWITLAIDFPDPRRIP